MSSMLRTGDRGVDVYGEGERPPMELGARGRARGPSSRARTSRRSSSSMASIDMGGRDMVGGGFCFRLAQRPRGCVWFDEVDVDARTEVDGDKANQA